jgi:hypothetical protein
VHLQHPAVFGNRPVDRTAQIIFSAEGCKYDVFAGIAPHKRAEQHAETKVSESNRVGKDEEENQSGNEQDLEERFGERQGNRAVHLFVSVSGEPGRPSRAFLTRKNAD